MLIHADLNSNIAEIQRMVENLRTELTRAEGGLQMLLVLKESYYGEEVEAEPVHGEVREESEAGEES